MHRHTALMRPPAPSKTSANAADDIVIVASSISTKTGRAPISAMAATVALAVLATVATASSRWTPTARNASSSASVPLATPSVCPPP